MRWHIWEFHTFLGKTLSEVLHIESLLSVQIPDASHKQKHALGVTTHYQTNAWPRGGSDFPVPRGNQTPESTVLPRQCPPNRYKTRSVAVCSSLRLHEASAKKKKANKKTLPASPLGTQLLRNALIWTSTFASANPSPKPIKSGDPSKLTSADLNRMESVLSRPNL